jgi:DNA-binding response OmpR family regulator
MSAGCLGAAGIWRPAMSAPALARAVGADDFIVKPFDPAVLLDKVRVLLARRD